MNDDKIENLWKWFSSNERQIINCIEKESSSERDYIVEHLDNLILDLGVFLLGDRPRHEEILVLNNFSERR